MQNDFRSFNIRDDSPLETAVLHGVLGSGRHGTVFQGQIANVDGPVAIKVAAEGQNLRNEVQALDTLSHPNIVTLYAHQLPSSIAVELCLAGTLTDRARCGAFEIDEVRNIFDGVTSALRYIHDAGWIHGDVSPSNIGLRPDDGPALFDFSTARKADGGEIHQGTQDYAGELRSAVASFDVRCTAAVIQSLLDPQTAEPEVVRIRGLLNELIEQADAGNSVDVADLRDALGLDESHHTADTSNITSPGQLLGAPPRPPANPTRDFGPRPGGQGPDDADVRDRSRRPMVAAAIAFGVFVALSVIALELFIAGGQRPTGEQIAASEASLQVERVLTAQRTLDMSAATWDIESGTLTRHNDDGTEVWKVGEAGDLAAIADWNCDGTETLGVLRPTTGVWFAFADWDSNSTSTVEYLDSDLVITGLDVALRSNGCANMLTAS